MFDWGKPNSKLLIVGEAPGEEEDRAGRPFIGASGKLLEKLLKASGFERADFNITNVFTRRPPGNDLKRNWTITKTELVKAGYTITGRLPKLGNRFIHPDHEPEVARLHEEIRQLQPELIIALGGTALWALTGESRITQQRGTLTPLFLGSSTTSEAPATITSTPALTAPSASSPSGATEQPAPRISSPKSSPSPKAFTSLSPVSSLLPSWARSLSPMWCLPSFHPALVIRQWDNRPLLWADLVKARRFIQGTLPEPLQRCLLVDPTLADLEEAYYHFKARPSLLQGVDIETDPRIGQITTISFAIPDYAVCIPFYNKAALPDQCNYWHTAREEAEAWKWVMRFAALPNPKVGQNFLYDHQYLLQDMDIRVRHIDDDTAIMQHTLQPELPKALGALASLYLNEPAWKFMRLSVKDENKADD